MKKFAIVIIILLSLVLVSCGKSTKDIMGLEFGNKAENVYSRLKEEGWNRSVNKRSYEIYQKSDYNEFTNPVLMLFYSGKGTGTFAYSSLTVNCYDQDALDRFNIYLAGITEVNTLELTLQKDFTDGSLKNQIEKGSPDSLQVYDYSVYLYQNSSTRQLGKDDFDIILLELHMYDKAIKKDFTEYQLYSLSSSSQKTVAKQLFEDTNIN